MTRLAAALLALLLALEALPVLAQSPSPTPSDLDVLVERITADIRAAVNDLPPGDLFCAPTPAPSAKPTPVPSPRPLPVCVRRPLSDTADLRAAVDTGLLTLGLEPVPACLEPWTDMVELALRLLDLSFDAVAAGSPAGRPMFAATGPVGYTMLTESAPALRRALDCEPPLGDAA